MYFLAITLPVLNLYNYHLASLNSHGLRRSVSVYFPPFIFLLDCFFFSLFPWQGKEKLNNRLNCLPRHSVFRISMALPPCASAKARVISFPFLSLSLRKFSARRATSPVPRPGAGSVGAAAPAPVRGAELAGSSAPGAAPASPVLSRRGAGCVVCLAGGCWKEPPRVPVQHGSCVFASP